MVQRTPISVQRLKDTHTHTHTHAHNAEEETLPKDQTWSKTITHLQWLFISMGDSLLSKVMKNTYCQLCIYIH